jgi:hypothetical protein
MISARLPRAVYFCLAACIPMGVLEHSAGTDHAGKTDPFTPSFPMADDRGRRNLIKLRRSDPTLPQPSMLVCVIILALLSLLVATEPDS